MGIKNPRAAGEGENAICWILSKKLRNPSVMLASSTTFVLALEIVSYSSVAFKNEWLKGQMFTLALS